MEDARCPGSHHQLKHVHGGCHLVFQASVPDAVEHDVGHIDLAHLNDVQGNDADEYELDQSRFEVEKPRKKSH